MKYEVTSLHASYPSYEDGTDRVFRNVGIQQSDAGEIPKRIHTIIFIVFPLQQWLHEYASMLRYKYTSCLVSALVFNCPPSKTIHFAEGRQTPFIA